jgi:hypothetical protein
MRKLINIEFDGVDSKDYPDFSDAFIVYAIDRNTGDELTDAEIEALDIGDYYDDLLESIR